MSTHRKKCSVSQQITKKFTFSIYHGAIKLRGCIRTSIFVRSDADSAVFLSFLEESYWAAGLYGRWLGFGTCLPSLCQWPGEWKRFPLWNMMRYSSAISHFTSIFLGRLCASVWIPRNRGYWLNGFSFLVWVALVRATAGLVFLQVAQLDSVCYWIWCPYVLQSSIRLDTFLRILAWPGKITQVGSHKAPIWCQQN